MQVESRVPAAPGAPRAVAKAQCVPFLLAGFATLPLHESLWPKSPEQSEERLKGLQKDEERVDGVLEGLAPTATEHVAQTRAAREDAVDAASTRSHRRESQREGQFRGAFRSMLAGARSGSAAAPSPPNQAKAEPGSATAETAPVASSPTLGRGDLAPQTERALNDAQSEAITPPASPRPAGQVMSSTAANPTAAEMVSRQPAASQLVGALAPVNATPQRAEPSPVSASSAPSAAPATAVVGSSGSANGKGDVESPDAARPSAGGETDAADSAADDRAENVERVLRVLRGSLRRDRTTTVIRLDPPELGALRLELDLRKDVLTLRMSAETTAAQDLLRDELDALRRGLETAGIRLERVEIQALVPAQDAPRFGAFADSGGRRGESSGDSGRFTRMALPEPTLRDGSEPLAASAGPAALVLGPARLNIVV